MITETGWNSSVGHHPSDNFCCQTTAAGQAADVAALLPLLARHRRAQRLLGFYFYTWAGAEQDGTFSFNFAGLFDDVVGPTDRQAGAQRLYDRGARPRALPPGRSPRRPLLPVSGLSAHESRRRRSARTAASCLRSRSAAVAE